MILLTNTKSRIVLLIYVCLILQFYSILVEAGSLGRYFRRVSNGLIGDSLNGILLPVAREDLKSFLYEFTETERQELKQVTTVYYMPTPALPKHVRKRAALQDLDPASSLPSFMIGDQVAFRYEIVQHLAKGSHGLVIKARDMARAGTEPKYVAIKVNQRSLSHLTTKESAILNQISFPPASEKRKSLRQRHQVNNHIVSVLQTVKYRGWDAWVFPYYPTDWNTLTRHQAVVDLKKLRKLVQDMLIALQYLQKHDIVHFDVKPENIMYEHVADSSYLTDFGLARHTKDIKAGEMFGSAPFMAPELLLNLKGSFASDIWSLGASLFTILTGQLLTRYDVAKDEYQSEADILRNLMTRVPPSIAFLSDTIIPRHCDLANFPDNIELMTGGNIMRVFEDIKGLYMDVDWYAYDDLADFVSRCLQWEPEQRMSIPEALQHPFINRIN